MKVYEVSYGLQPSKGEYIANFAAINVLVGIDDVGADDAEAAILAAKEVAKDDIAGIRGKHEIKIEGVKLLLKDVR